jgi:hypothetical protein
MGDKAAKKAFLGADRLPIANEIRRVFVVV